MAGIRFHSQEIPFKLKHPKLISEWLEAVARKERASFESLDYVFCSDEYLLKINQDFLDHHDLTDIITFNYTEPQGSKRKMEGEIYISIPRVQENAQRFNSEFNQELHRVMVHGVLHLVGYMDSTPTQKAAMREKEDACLSLRRFHVKH
jgi:probable rRNA maturation factor